MRLGRVLSRLYGAAHHPAYEGQTLLLVAPLDESGKAAGATIVACDTVQAGPGDLVLVLQEGNGSGQVLAARQAAGTGQVPAQGGKRPPIRSLIVAVVDEVHRPD